MGKDFSMWYSVLVGGNTSKVKCKACGLEFAKKVSRMLSHLGYEGSGGSRDTGVKICTRLTIDVKNLFARCKGEFPQKFAVVENIDHTHTLVVDTFDNEMSNRRGMQEDSCTVPEELVRSISEVNPITETSGERETPRGSSSRPRRQSRLADGFDEASKRNLHAVWANCFYTANIPFAVARNPAFIEAVKKTVDFHKAYAPPSYNDLRGKLLDQAKADIQSKLQKRTEDSIRKFGATLSIDGWSSVANRPLINAMLVSSAGEQFLGSVDTSGVEKTAPFLASVLETFIEKVGPSNVVQVTTDNTAVNPAAWKLVEDKYPHIFWQGCVVHALNLMLKDWVDQQWIKDVVEPATTIVKFIRRRHKPLAIFRTHSTNLQLLMAGATRFGSIYMMIDRLLTVKKALEKTVMDPEWDPYVRTLTNKKKKRSSKKKTPREKSKEVRTNILDEHFWNRCNNVKEVLAPVYFALRDLDAKTPCMGKVLHIFRDIKKHVFSLRHPPFCLSVERAIPLEKSFCKRHQMVNNDMHYAGALLNPYLLHDKDLADDQDAFTACKNVIQKICTPQTYAQVVKEFMAFRLREPPFHNMLDPQEQILSAHAWWDFEGACGKLIAPIAKRILAQPVSSSSCERNWSSYSFVHNKSRNKLTTERAADLVYVYTNSKLLAASRENDEKKWYLENVDSEESEGIVSEDNLDCSTDEDDADGGENLDDVHECHEVDDREDVNNDPNNVQDLSFNGRRPDNENHRSNGIEVYEFKDEDKDEKQVTDDPKSPQDNNLPVVELKTAVTTLDGSGSSQAQKGLFSPSRRHPTVNPGQTFLPSTDDEKSMTLAAFRNHVKDQKAQKSTDLSNSTSKSMKTMKITIHGAPKVEKSEVKECTQKGKRREMQPFACTPTKKQHVHKNPLDSILPFSQAKTKQVNHLWGTIGEEILRIKKEKKEGTQMIFRTSKRVRKEVLRTTDSSSDDVEDTWSEEERRKDKVYESSGAEVKGDSDWNPRAE